MKILVERPRIPKGAAYVRVGMSSYTIVDKSAYGLVKRFQWKLHKSHSGVYVVRAIVRNGKEKLIWLHRWLTHCPDGMEPHHWNGNRLDNRRCNLENVTPDFNRKLRIFRQTHSGERHGKAKSDGPGIAAR